MSVETHLQELLQKRAVDKPSTYRRLSLYTIVRSSLLFNPLVGGRAINYGVDRSVKRIESFALGDDGTISWSIAASIHDSTPSYRIVVPQMNRAAVNDSMRESVSCGDH